MTRHLDRILERVYLHPWAILPARHKAIQAILQAHLETKGFFDLPDTDEEDDAQGYDVVGTVAVIPIEGTILNKCSGLEAMCGAFSLQSFKQTLREVAARPDVTSIVLNISSGGGTVTGTPEAADLIAEVAAAKPIYAYTDDCIASAAYWLASQTRGIFLSKSAELGSIGVYCAYLDESKAYAMEGLKVELFKGGNSAFKAMGYEGTSLSDEQKAYLQAGVDKTYAEFVSTVKAKRPNATADAYTGKMFDADEAVKNGLADGCINELDSLIAYLNGK